MAATNKHITLSEELRRITAAIAECDLLAKATDLPGKLRLAAAEQVRELGAERERIEKMLAAS